MIKPVNRIKLFNFFEKSRQSRKQSHLISNCYSLIFNFVFQPHVIKFPIFNFIFLSFNLHFSFFKIKLWFTLFSYHCPKKFFEKKLCLLYLKICFGNQQYLVQTCGKSSYYLFFLNCISSHFILYHNFILTFTFHPFP